MTEREYERAKRFTYRPPSSFPDDDETGNHPVISSSNYVGTPHCNYTPSTLGQRGERFLTASTMRSNSTPLTRGPIIPCSNHERISQSPNIQIRRTSNQLEEARKSRPQRITSARVLRKESPTPSHPSTFRPSNDERSQESARISLQSQIDEMCERVRQIEQAIARLEFVHPAGNGV